MVLPIRVWGTDEAGKPFVCLAHTLDVTPKGARIGSFSAMVKTGERIGITRGTKKAHFRVAWIGQASTPTEEQIGVELIDAKEDIWGLQLPGPEPDEYKRDAARNETLSPSTPNSANPNELTAYLRDLAERLQAGQNLVQQTWLHSAVVEEFLAASSQVRNISHVIARSLNDQGASEDAHSLLVLLNTQRVQTACSICAALTKDLPVVRSMLPRQLLENLVQDVGNLFALAANFEVVDAGPAFAGDSFEDGSSSEPEWDREQQSANRKDKAEAADLEEVLSTERGGR
jgi:hypothetical protein